MSIQHANRGIVKKDLQLYYNREFSKCFRGEATTNLIGTYGGGSANSYPSSGNYWGTYYARGPYGSGAFYSIGTIASVSGNVITISSPTANFNALATFDVIRPQTTGGGVTANTDYYFKRLSSTTFILHQYDGTNDASKTPEQILSSINSDTRITVNATSFPTMWWGYPHLPNSALIKTAITNGFAFDNRLHDCLRFYWFRSDAVDAMAYGVQPNYTGSTAYTFSAYIRASNQGAIGQSMRVETYYAGPITGAVAGLYSASGTSLASYSPDANTGFVFVPNATSTVYTVNTSNSYITGAVVTRQALDLGSAPATTWTPSGWNSLQNAYADDQNVASNLHLNILFNNTSRGTVYIGSNFFITFGGGSNVTNPSSTNPALDKIMMNSGDRSYQRVGYKYGFK